MIDFRSECTFTVSDVLFDMELRRGFLSLTVTIVLESYGCRVAP